ncbi:hypothetical protein P5G50_18305 [Leifsonia sp. F6_8S_P_1B]|uniref:Uncharacterized protein n=1 Tax=Leifsonia williamsii TaxID=3035919 RepID=A0ABT8KG15_9MICO|nr:hypothetical protein [Leifsonia williamsii]MDN4616404.1 hypothetical protein [Leifsonia williamsii]
MFYQVKHPQPQRPRILAVVLTAALICGGGAAFGSQVDDDVAFIEGGHGL